jgi:hypothetical protein
MAWINGSVSSHGSGSYGRRWKKDKEDSSFLKKRSKRLLFLRSFTRVAGGARAGSKSLLLLFFRKEDLPSYPFAALNSNIIPAACEG